MEAEETIREIVRKYGEVLYHGKEEETRGPGAVEQLKLMWPQEKLLTLRIKKPLEGMFIEGWLENPDSFFKVWGPRIYEAHLYSIQQNFWCITGYK